MCAATDFVLHFNRKLRIILKIPGYFTILSQYTFEIVFVLGARYGFLVGHSAVPHGLRLPRTIVC